MERQVFPSFLPQQTPKNVPPDLNAFPHLLATIRRVVRGKIDPNTPAKTKVGRSIHHLTIMANQVTFIVNADELPEGISNPEEILNLRADAFLSNGEAVAPPSSWAQFILNGKVWEPARYGDQPVPVIIGKGVLAENDTNSFVAYAVKVLFNASTEDAVVVLGVVAKPACNPENNPCYTFTILDAVGVEAELLTNGEPVSGTQLPKRCDC